MCPFDIVIRPFSDLDNTDDDRFPYFRQIRSALLSHGFVAFHSRVSWAALTPIVGSRGLECSRILFVPLAQIFKDLTRDSCHRFDEMTREFEENSGVRYWTYAGVQPLKRVFLPYRLTYRISLRSAAWREVYFVEKMDADHLNIIGWWNRGGAFAGADRETFEKNIREFYVRMAKSLKVEKPLRA
jgi:hypothetical protein